ncbi:MAG: low molecular weight protein-tyrosine phosphatase [Mycobacteriales bacterium]
MPARNLVEVPAPTATVLCVCTANVSRSVAAELLLRAGLRRRLGAEPDDLGLRVHSAGVWANPGRPVEPGTAAALRAHGVTTAEVAAAVSAPLGRSAVAGADLVLAAAAEHVHGVWRLQLAARQRTFTLAELAGLATRIVPDLLPPDDPIVRLRALVSAADAIRSAHSPARRGPDGDPGPGGMAGDPLDDPDPDGAAELDMVARTAAQVDTFLDLLIGRPLAPARLPWPIRAVQWSRSRARRGASR